MQYVVIMLHSFMQTLPLLTIDQSLNFHKSMHATKPSFGMDIFEEGFRSEGFVILENNGSGCSSAYSRCGHFIFILTLKGGAIRHINQHTYITKEHSLQLLVPGVIHNFEDTHSDSESLILLFDREFLSIELDELVNFHTLNPEFVALNGIELTKVLAIYEQLNLESKNKNIDYKEICKTLLTQLLYLLKREKLFKLTEHIQNRGEQIVSQFLCLIEEHFQVRRSVQEYADILEITPKHLSETIKKKMNASALSFIHKRQIKEIQYLLVYSDKSIKQIASLLNFETSSDLGRFFKRYVGLSPKNYRLSITNP